jgi:hypothetical protein
MSKDKQPAASSGVFCIMPDLIRHPVRFLDSGIRRNDGTRGKPITELGFRYGTGIA